MKVGDLVKYRHYHNKLSRLRGVVIAMDKKGERASVFWNRSICNDDTQDWVEDMEVVSSANN